MPKYAVAVGRKVGIYDTYNECLEQVNKFPGAKYKKFNTAQEAQAYINTHSKPGKFVPLPPSMPQQAENKMPSESFPVEKVSPSNPIMNALCKRLSALEEKLEKFISSTNETLECLKSKVEVLTIKRAFEEVDQGEQGSSKRAKTDLEWEDMDLPLMDPSTENFLTDANGLVLVYTDGACSNNGKYGAKAGIGVWFNHNHPLNVSAPVKGPPTNNNAEIQAARIAVTQARSAGIKKICVYTDSKFLINCITQWIHKWKKNKWQLSTGGEVKNKEELIKLDIAIQGLEFVQWEYVAGHRGIEGNEMADKLARKGAEMFKTNVTYPSSIL
jgi:ribonuclease HI